MGQIKKAFKERIEQNSKNYHPKDLFDLGMAKIYFGQMRETFGVETLLTTRHGETLIEEGEFDGFEPDVVNNPGIRIRVKGRTVCHIYVKYDKAAKEQTEVVKTLLDAYIKTLEGCGEKSYAASEQAMYIDELEQELEKEAYQAKYDEQNDPLTGVLNKSSFIKNMEQLKEREVVPTAVICVNINDWLFVHDNFGEEASDRLIVTVAEILKSCADEQTVIGRIGGDVFHVLIPMTEEEEARQYCRRVQEACHQYEDAVLAPSVAIGCVMKTNVEESFKNLFSDAEYAMYEDKLVLKKAQGYRERLEKGLNLK